MEIDNIHARLTELGVKQYGSRNKEYSAVGRLEILLDTIKENHKEEIDRLRSLNKELVDALIDCEISISCLTKNIPLGGYFDKTMSKIDSALAKAKEQG